VNDVADMTVDFIEAGSSGPLVMLVHSSVSGARQWGRLIDDLQDRFRVRAVNLFGYGRTPAWPQGRMQSLDDQARLVEAALPRGAGEICLVGHSFGGAVAMKAAARLGARVRKLVLLETNPFDLLAQHGCVRAYAEAAALRDCVKTCGDVGEWSIAAERFADYWSGAGTWRGMRLERRAAFAQALMPNYFEWDAVMNDDTTAADWAALLPTDTLLISDPHSARPIREITTILRRACPAWHYQEVPGAGHMAPLTRPDLINPLIRAFLCAKIGAGCEQNHSLPGPSPIERRRSNRSDAHADRTFLRTGHGRHA
jgi:pimeloyl-ACP methyl ester carboxylesterase